MRVAPSSIAAVVVSSTIASATDAPMPTDSAPGTLPSSAGSAVVSDVESDSAFSDTSAPRALTTEPVLSSASVRTSTRFSPSPPATLTEPPPAPDLASAPKSCVEPAPVSSASTTTPSAVTVAPDATNASLTTSARLIATPAPIATPEPPGCTAEPSAPAFASVCADVRSVSAPPATIVTPVGTNAREIEFAMLIPTAAATETPPEEVDAAGVAEAPPVPPPPFAVEAEFAKVRCSAT